MFTGSSEPWNWSNMSRKILDKSKRYLFILSAARSATSAMARMISSNRNGIWIRWRPPWHNVCHLQHSDLVFQLSWQTTYLKGTLAPSPRLLLHFDNKKHGAFCTLEFLPALTAESKLLRVWIANQKPLAALQWHHSTGAAVEVLDVQEFCWDLLAAQLGDPVPSLHPIILQLGVAAPHFLLLDRRPICGQLWRRIGVLGSLPMPCSSQKFWCPTSGRNCRACFHHRHGNSTWGSAPSPFQHKENMRIQLGMPCFRGTPRSS